MADNSTLLTCSICNRSNPVGARFCQYCGTKIIQICLQCETENFIEAEYCRSCGTKLSEAKLGISEERAKEWYNHFMSFSGYSELWDEKYIKTLFNECGNLKDTVKPNTSNPQQDFGKLALSLPIVSENWCIKLLQLNSEQVTKGAMAVREKGFIVCGLNNKVFRKILYEDLTNVSVDGDIITLKLANADTIQFSLQIPRPFWSVGFHVLDLLGSMVDGRAMADPALNSERLTQKGNELNDEFKMANNFVASIYQLFAEIIEKKQKLQQN